MHIQLISLVYLSTHFNDAFIGEFKQQALEYFAGLESMKGNLLGGDSLIKIS